MFKLNPEGVVVKPEAQIHDTIKANFNRRTNCFITGPAGTGKSHAIDQLVEHTDTVVTVTASTGVAAMNVSGVTIHSWSGINIKSHPKMLQSIVDPKKNPRWTFIKHRLLETKVLVIDEIGMLKAGQLDLINDVCRYAYYGDKYKSGAPFGGIQVICTGDFLQLPPVSNGNEDEMNYLWAFESDVWKAGGFKTFALSKIWRQDDLDFCRVLNKIRAGVVDKEVIDMLRSREGAKLPEGVVPMRFVGTNQKVKDGNTEELRKATGRPHSFGALISVDPKFSRYAESVRKEIITNTRMEEVLELKEGMPIVMLANRSTDTEYFMNGSLGTFLGVNTVGFPIVKLHKTGAEMAISKYSEELKMGDGVVKATISQFPIRIGHYSTFHKAQGLTLDYVEADLARLFAPGMAYTGLSRVTSLDGLVIKNFNPRGIKANVKALRFYGLRS